VKIVFQGAPIHETIAQLLKSIVLMQRKTVSKIAFVSLATNISKPKKKNHLQFRII
jgi:hypothetical protein